VLSGGYRWRGIPDWKPGDTRYRQSDQPSASGGYAAENAAKCAERMARFAEMRAGEMSIAEAARRLGVSYKTAQGYERRRRAGSGEAASAVHR
jgi:DNA-binding transcriptional regulator YiaG